MLDGLSSLPKNITETGYSVHDDIFTANQVSTFLSYFNKKTKELKPAAIGYRAHQVVNTKHRSDATLWIEESDTKLASYFKMIESVTKLLRMKLFLPIRQTETQMALYKKGQFYDRHRDRHIQSGHRWVTCVYYLNLDWAAEDGGELVIHNLLNSPLPKTIEPLCNRVVFFLSELEHEVKVTSVPRRSFTTWFRDDIN